MNHPAQEIVHEIEWMADMGLGFIDLTLEPPRAASWKVDPKTIGQALTRHHMAIVGHTAFYLPIASGIEEIRRASLVELRRCVDVFGELGARWMKDLILDIIMAHTGELKANPDKYVKFLRAIYKAVDYFNANQEAAIPIIAKQFSITADDFKATLPNFRYTPLAEAKDFIGTVDKEGRVYEIFNEAMDLNLEFGSSDVKLNPEDHIDRTIINKLQ